MKKRLISLFLAFDMILSPFPISAFAETPSEQPVVEVRSAQELLEAVRTINQKDGNNTISLKKDITLENGEEIKLTRGETTILGNGHTISGGRNQTLWVSDSAVLNLGRQDGTDKLTFEGNDQSITAVSVSGQAELNVYEGVTIENYHNSGVKVGAGAAFTMNGGTIQNCSAKDGGGVAVCGERNGNIQSVTPAGFTMSGGTIRDCTATEKGGGVAADYAEVTISGGSIENCSAVQGGGINFEDGTLILSGGSIDGCSASSPDTGGGGIALRNTAADLHLTLTGGSITNNRADNGSGGGIWVMPMGKFTADAVNNITITGNSASRGGGVYGFVLSLVDMSAPSNTLCNNTAQDAGADICMDYGSIKLPDAASMNRNLGTTGHKIDGWYIDGMKADTAGHGASCDRYTPNEHGEAQDVTTAASGPLGLVASYKRERHKITVTAPEPSYGAEAKVDGSKVESALEGERVSLSYDDTALKENETFEKWTATDANGDPVEIKRDAAGAYFVMPESDVTVVFSICPAGVEPDVPAEPSGDSGAAGSIIAGAVICAAGYYVGTELYLETVFGDVPANRQALASALWEKAGRPEPESTALYTDVDAQNADAQKADRWCVEQRLIPDRGEDTFRPAGWVTHAECIVSWKKLEKMLKSAVK